MTMETLAPNVTRAEGRTRFRRWGLCAPLCPQLVRGPQEMSPALCCGVPIPLTLPTGCSPDGGASWPCPVRRCILRWMRHSLLCVPEETMRYLPCGSERHLPPSARPTPVRSITHNTTSIPPSHLAPLSCWEGEVLAPGGTGGPKAGRACLSPKLLSDPAGHVTRPSSDKLTGLRRLAVLSLCPRGKSLHKVLLLHREAGLQ